MAVDKRPLIAIVGSADETRKDELDLRNLDKAAQAAEEIGFQLAEQGYRIIVYSRDPKFIEGDFVRGYLRSSKVRPNSIQVRYPIHQTKRFKEEEGATQKIFDVQPCAVGGWELPFYQSLTEADGAVLMGGGRSTYIAGILAVATHLPLIALAGFGGDAQEVLQLLDRNGHPAPEADRHFMGAYEGNDSDKAVRLVHSLAVQRKLLQKGKEQETRRSSGSARALWGIAALMLSMIMTVWAIFSNNLTPICFGFILFGIPIVGGVAGALTHTLAGAKKLSIPAPYSITETILYGMLAGFVTAMGFLISNVVTSLDFNKFIEQAHSNTTQRFLIFSFSLIISIIAGLTLERTLKAIRKVDVSKHIDVLGETATVDKPEKSGSGAG